MRKSDDRESADVFDFIDEYLGDLEAGKLHELAHYLARFPDNQDSIAREYLSLKSPHPDETSASGAPPTSMAGTAGAADAPGAQRVGPYRLLRELGRGGQGTVFLAEDARIARRVALKILTSRFDTVSDERLKRFRREAEVIARLEHPGICGIYDADIDGPTPYIAMRYVEGATLAETLAQARRERANPEGNGNTAGVAHTKPALPDSPDSEVTTSWPPLTPLDVHRVLLLFERCARALHAAHEAGVIHRDVKPGNVIVTHDGKPVMLDFGLARDEASNVGSLTASDEVFGTPAYMSPEQLRGGDEVLDRRTDVYSLGVSMYEALTLERPFEAPSRAALYFAIQDRPAADPRAHNKALGEDVKVVLETAMEKDRARRYPTALELAEDLRRIREYEPIRARPASVGLRLARWTRRHPVLAVIIPGTIIALSVGLVVTQSLLRAEKIALSFALGRYLAERSLALIAEDPGAALAVGIMAVERGDSYLTRSGLLSTLDACWLEGVLDPNRWGNTKQGIINDIALNPNGRSIAVACNSVHLFELSTCREERWLSGHTKKVQRVVFSPDGRLLVSASADGTARVWDTTSWETLRVLREEHASGAHAFNGLEISPDGTRLALVCEMGEASIWSLRDWKQESALEGDAVGIERARFSPDGALIVGWRSAVSPLTHEPNPASHTASVWSAIDGKKRFDLEGHSAPIVYAEFSASSSLVVTTSKDKSARVWSLATGRGARDPLLHEETVSFATFSPDASALLTATGEGEFGWAYRWDLSNGEKRRLEGHEGRRVRQAAFSPDGGRIATASSDQTARIWDARTGDQELELRSMYGPVGLRWSLDGRRLITHPNGPVAHVWFTENRPDLFDLKGHSGPVRSVAFSPDGTQALTACDDGRARVFHVPTDRDAGDPREPGVLLFELLHDGPVTRAAFSADGAEVLTLSEDGTARLWSARSGEPLRAPMRHPGAVDEGSIDRAGGRVLTISGGVARLWSARSDEKPIELTQSGGDGGDGGREGARVLCAAFDPRSSLCATGADDDRVRIFDAQTGALVRTITYTRGEREENGVVDLAFDPAADEIAAACRDQKVRFWNPRTGQVSREALKLFVPENVAYSTDGRKVLVVGQRGGGAVRVQSLDSMLFMLPEIYHTRSITSGSFSADGSLVLTSSKDQSVYVREAESGIPRLHRTWPSGAILCAAFNGETEIAKLRVISASEHGTVSIWPVDPLTAARRRQPRELEGWEIERESRIALPLEFE